jgi:murein DD-endopeptidase MepM/ murein hydrolase activator NlpD
MPVTMRRKEPKEPKPDRPTKPDKPTTTPGYRIGSYGNASIDQWDEAFVAASDFVWDTRKVRIDPRFLKAMMDVETGGNGNYPPSQCRPCDGTDCVPACGPMQIKQKYHQYKCPDCSFKTLGGQIALAAHILAYDIQQRGGDAYDALTRVYFPTDDVNGTTQNAYVARIRKLIAAMEEDAGDGKPPDPTPDPEPRDVVDAILNGAATDQSYGFKHPTDLPYYAYFEGHGGNANQHTGIDATTVRDQPLYAPIAGTVVCGGTGVGSGAWGQGCAAFGDTMGAGAGRVEILAEDGKRSLILGHVSRSLVRPGDKVTPGQKIALAGGMNGWHVHIEAREWDGKQYWIRDPRAVFPGKGKQPRPDTVEYVWDSPNRNTFLVTVDVDNLVARQRADTGAERLYPIKQGETFEAVALVPGNDGNGWWLATNNARVPMGGTRYTVKIG